MNAIRTLAPLLLGILLFAAACGGGDDDTSSSDSAGSAGSNAAPAATAANDDAESSSDSSSDDGDSAGTVTIGDESWGVVPSVQCSFTDASGIPVVSIAGHAASDESIEITIDFDPRDTGLTLTVKGAGEDPSWTAINETFTTHVGGTRISGEGTFSNAPIGADTAEGSFEVAC